MSRTTKAVLLAAALAVLHAASASAALTFAPAASYGAGTSPSAVAGGDFNGDGDRDLVVTNETGNSVSVLLGTGAGTFAAKTDYAVGSGPISVVVADFNRDGKPDLATANFTSSSVSVLLGTGNGSFAPKADFATGTDAHGSGVGDFNRDGNPDLVVTNYSGASVSVLLGTGTGSFGPKTDFATLGQPTSVAIGDFNRDSFADLAVSNFANNLTTGQRISVLLGTGTGSFGTKTDYSTGATGSLGSSSRPLAVATGDLNGDGYLDLVSANYNTASVSVLLGVGDGTFAAPVRYFTSEATGPLTRASHVVVRDLDRDGTLDLAVANHALGVVAVLLGNGDGTFPPEAQVPHLATQAGPIGLAVADIDNDGAPDLASANSGAGSTSVLRMAPTASADTASITFTTPQPQGTVSPGQGVTVTNSGSAPLTITGATIGGADAGDFVVGATTCMDAVLPGGSCTVTVRFVPEVSSGSRSASLTIGSNAPTAVPAITLSGTAAERSQPAGPTGASPAGPAGGQGAPGAEGPAGDPGPNGPIGPTGTSGPTGADGAAGPSGAAGAVGTSGVRGDPGPDGKLTCKTRKAKRLARVIVRCAIVLRTNAATAAWRLTRSGRIVARGAAITHNGRARVDLARIRPRLSSGRYTLRLGRRSITVLVLHRSDS